MQRHTKQADEFLALLTELEGPFTVDDVSAHLAEHAHELSRATLFRYLALAVRSGQLTVIPHLGDERLYERVSSHHHHLACPSCETVQELDEPCAEPLGERAATLVRVLPCASCAAV